MDSKLIALAGCIETLQQDANRSLYTKPFDQALFLSGALASHGLKLVKMSQREIDAMQRHELEMIDERELRYAR